MRGVKLAALAIALAAPATSWGQATSKPKVTGEIWVLYPGQLKYLRTPQPGLIRRADVASDPENWLKPADFPPDALLTRSTGAVLIEVRVDADDSVADCVVVRPADDDRLSHAACPLIRKRGAFRQALGDDGMPRADTIRLEVGFELVENGNSTRVYSPPAAVVFGIRDSTPMTQPEPLSRNALVLRPAPISIFPRRDLNVELDIDAQGTVTRCTVLDSTGTDQGDLRLCRHLLAVRFSPKRDSSGRAHPAGRFVVSPILKR